MEKDLQMIAIDIYDFCKKHNITISRRCGVVDKPLAL